MDQNMTSEAQFLESYDASKYERPSVTSDIVVLTMDECDKLSILMIKRGGYPYKDRWALPGGFLAAGKESLEEAAARELYEETGIADAYLKQLATFSNPKRDPRTHVISVAYTALIPKEKLSFHHGDDAKDAMLFNVYYDEDNDTLVLAQKDTSGNIPIPISIAESQIAFDHAEIIKTAIKRLRGRISYEPDAFDLLKDKTRFTMYELQKIFEAIKGKKFDPANFRKMIDHSYIKYGLVCKMNATRKEKGRRPAALYAFANTRYGLGNYMD